jgi:hypothetical protein
MHGAIYVFEQEGLEGLINQARKEPGEPMDVVMTNCVSTPKLDPKNLTNSQDEACQEQ